ncbi:helix-turn-helix domain-containing protein [Paenibacillus ginsengarvi]|uniref:AraC family transcriptional regulator n=1 Tax=Paenibacillus ginsengarvi TaxID=400777 RepID=A0A3B0CKZ8_9BACL|nr:AraC family transcriptional regulator [Paenibacillus ginsengarvi]RKN85521.1 AraC family transcriptional regulator [Paenibacillus ginsengarvi]
MHKPLLSGFLPQVNLSFYWENKERFLLYEDVYKMWVLFAVVSGSFYYEIGDEKGSAAFGDIVLCPPDTPFRRVVNAPLTFYYFEFIWADTQQLGPQRGEEMLPTGKISILDTNRLAQNYTMMKKWRSWPLSVRIPQYNHFCQDLWLLYCDGLGEGNLPAEKAFDPHSDPLMQEAQRLIQQRAFATLNLKEIASALDITPVQLTKKFNAAFGVTPLRYLTSLRLNKAKTLLLETKMTIEQISECCGYQNGFYLNRVFVKYEHTTPSLYRKTHRI